MTRDGVKDPAERTKVRKEVRKVFEERYKAGKNKWYAFPPSGLVFWASGSSLFGNLCLSACIVQRLSWL